MEKKLFLLLMVTALVFAVGFVVACGDDDDDDDDAGDDDTDPFADDDDDTEDDDTDDDATDDDVDGPVLSNGYWDPATFTYTEPECNTTACTAIMFSVCDPDGDLVAPGGCYFYLAGTTDQFFAEQPISWDGAQGLITAGTDVTDCDNPVETGIGMLMGEGFFEGADPGTYEMGIDIEGTDAAGNISNKLSNVTVAVVWEG